MEIRVQWMRLFEVISCGCVSESRFGRQTRVIQTDFTEGHHIYPAITEDLKDLEIGILGNLSYDRRCVPSNTFWPDDCALVSFLIPVYGLVVNNVGMNYSGVLTNFLDVPNCEQVWWAKAKSQTYNKKRMSPVLHCALASFEAYSF